MKERRKLLHRSAFIPYFLYSSTPLFVSPRPFRGRSGPHATIIFLAVAASLFVLLDARTRGLIENSLRLAACTALVVVPVGLLLATFLVKFALPGRRWASILLISGMFLPLYLVATAWQSALGLQGWAARLMAADSGPGPILSGWTGAVFIHAVALLPIVTLLIAAGLASAERELEEDALLRVPPRAVVLRVTWRRGIAAVFAAAVWAFVVCLGEMTVTDLFQIRTFAEEIYVQTAGGAIWDLAGGALGESPAVSSGLGSYVLGTLFIVSILLGAMWLCLGVARRWHRIAARERWIVARERGGWLGGVLFAIVALMGIPLASLLYQAGLFAREQDGGFDSAWSFAKAVSLVGRAPAVHREELLSTIIVASAAACAATSLATLLGMWAAVRVSGKLASAAVAALLAAIPGPLLGLGIIRLLNQPPDSPAALLAVLYDEATFGFAPWLAQTLRVLPFAILVLVPAVSRTQRTLLDAAVLDGAGAARKVADVYWPLHWRSIAIAWLVSFILAAGELSATVLVAPPGITPLSVRIFTLVHYGVDDQLAGLVLFVWASVLLLTAAVCLLARRIGRREV